MTLAEFERTLEEHVIAQKCHAIRLAMVVSCTSGNVI